MSPKKTNYLRDPRISWMDFNHRVLQEAGDSSVPLVERIRFLGIYSNNLDEFFRVRVALLSRLVQLKGHRKDGATYPEKPWKVLELINAATAEQMKIFDRLYVEILAELACNKVRLLNETELNAEQSAFLRNFFHKNLINSLNPIILREKKNFPSLSDGNLYLLVDFPEKNGRRKECALVEVPTVDFPRFIRLPDDGDTQCLILLDDVIRFNLEELFLLFEHKKFNAYAFKITRDADLELSQDLNRSLLEKISRGIRNRKKGEAVRLEHDGAMPDYLLKFLKKCLHIDGYDTIMRGGRYHNFKDFMKFPDFGRAEFVNAPCPPASAPEIEQARSMLELARAGDFSLHYPYQDFSYFIRFLREAAIDPAVESIKITMYRLAGDSRVVRTLINAARNGKHVTAVVELFARFDESANVNWARSMEEAGIKVVLGVEGLKVHSKLILVTRKGGDIACISTGNFHEGNARVYTDFALFTADSRITREVAEVFHFINQPFHLPRLRHMLVSPLQMRKKLLAHIRREIVFAKEGVPAWIIGKVNHLADIELITCLREAGQAGVNVRLVVRGYCAMIPAECENIEITSIIDRNLEHSRIFLFANGGEEIGYVGSADWMTRNLDDRIEAAVPVYSPEILQEIKTIVEYALRDNTKARIIDGSGENKFKPVPRGAKRFRSQTELYRYYQRKAEVAKKLKTGEPASEKNADAQNKASTR